MDNSMKEQIEKLNKISPIKSITTEDQYDEKGNIVITKEIIKVEKDGEIKEANVILSFVAGEEGKPFIAYTFEKTEDKDENYKTTIDISEVVLEEKGYSLVTPSQEDYKNVVVPAIIAIGNSNLDDPEQVEDNVRNEINDPNFEVVSLNTIGQYVERFEEEYVEEKDSVFAKVLNAASVLIPVSKLRVIEKIYIKKVNKMWSKALTDLNKNLSKEELQEKIAENDAVYNKVADLMDNFSNYSDKTNVDEDINKLSELQETLDTARDIYIDKVSEIEQEELESQNQEINNNEEEQETVIEPEVVEEEKNEPVEEQTVENEEIASVDNSIIEENSNIVEPAPIIEETNVEPINDEIVDKNADIPKITDEIINRKEMDELIDSILTKLRNESETIMGEFNSNIDSYAKQLLEQLTEKYNRKMDETVTSIMLNYEGAYKKLYHSLTTGLDKYMLQSQTEIGETKNANSILNSKLETKEKELEEVNKHNKELKKTVDEKDNIITDLNAEKEKDSSIIDEQKNQISRLETTIIEKDKKISDLEVEKKKEETEKDKLNIELKTKDSKIKELTANLEKTEEINAEYKSQLETMNKNMNEMRENNEKYRRESEKRINILEAKLNGFQEFFNNMKTLQNSVNAMSVEYSEEEKEGKTK